MNCIHFKELFIICLTAGWRLIFTTAELLTRSHWLQSNVEYWLICKMAEFGGKDHLELMAGSSEYKCRAYGGGSTVIHTEVNWIYHVKEVRHPSSSHQSGWLRALLLSLTGRLLSLHAVGFFLITAIYGFRTNDIKLELVTCEVCSTVN